jgi:hypothetical protein
MTASANTRLTPDGAIDLRVATRVSDGASSDVILRTIPAPADSPHLSLAVSGETTARHRRLDLQWTSVTVLCREELMANPDGELRPELVQVLLRTGMGAYWAEWIMTGPDSETWRLSERVRGFVEMKATERLHR